MSISIGVKSRVSYLCALIRFPAFHASESHSTEMSCFSRTLRHVARHGGWYECSYHQLEHVLSATESPQSQKNKILDLTPHLANRSIHLPSGYVTDSQVF